MIAAAIASFLSWSLMLCEREVRILSLNGLPGWLGMLVHWQSSGSYFLSLRDLNALHPAVANDWMRAFKFFCF